jgi:hypothetical protein
MVLGIFTLLGSLWMGLLSRVIGGNKGEIFPAWFNPFKDWVYALPYALVGLLLGHSLEWSLEATIGVGVASLLGGLYGKRMGHGRAIDMGTVGGTPLGDGLSLAWSGMVVTLIPSFLLAFFVSINLGLILLVSGALKSVAYYIGWLQGDLPKLGNSFREPTQRGEFLTGLFGGFGVFFVLLKLLGV